MPISGDIQTFSLAAVGRMIHAEKKTGILKIAGEGEFIRFFFNRGDIVFVEGEMDEAFSLEALLVAEHLATADTLQEAKNIARREKKDLSSVLMEKGFVSGKNLARLLHFRVKEAAAKALTWKEGIFEYQDGLNNFHADVPLKIDTTRLLAEAAKWKEFRSLIPNDRAIFHIKNADSRHESFSAQGVHRVMLMIDGARDVYEILEETGMPRIGVYKALQNLCLQGVIELEKNGVDTDTLKIGNRKKTLKYYVKLVNEVMADLELEMGRKKSESLLDQGMKETNQFGFFLQLLKGGEPTDTNIERMNAWMLEQQQDVSAKDLLNGFQKILLFLLKEENRLLGFKTFRNTAQRILSMSEKADGEERQIAAAVIAILKNLLKDQKELTATDGSFNGLTTGSEPKSGHDIIPFPHLSQIGGATIIAFYSRVLQVVMADLENAIGSKAGELMGKILASSPYHEKFLSQYQVKEDVKTNVERIRTHISEKGYRLSKISFIKGFQQVLIGLLQEETQLLGKKPANASVRKIEGQIPFFQQKEFKWLADHLLQTIRAHGELSIDG